MTDIEAKALALVNEVAEERVKPRYVSLARMGDTKIEALCRAIEQHEADRLAEKAVEDYTDGIRSEERAKVVALLREMAISFPEGGEHRLSAIAITCAADGIERGDHLGKSK